MPIFIPLKNLLADLSEVGLSLLLCRLALGIVSLSEAGLSSLVRPRGGELSTCLWEAFCSLAEAISVCEIFA